MDAHIRSARPDDAPLIAELLRELGWFEHINSEPPGTTVERVHRHIDLCLADSSHTLLIAEDAQGAPLGYLAAHWLPYLFLPGPEGYISELFVRPSARGVGVGSQLLQAAREEAQARGCYRLSLLNGRQRESYQRQFYPGQGWEERPLMANFVFRLAKPSTSQDGEGR